MIKVVLPGFLPGMSFPGRPGRIKLMLSVRVACAADRVYKESFLANVTLICGSWLFVASWFWLPAFVAHPAQHHRMIVRHVCKSLDET